MSLPIPKLPKASERATPASAKLALAGLSLSVLLSTLNTSIVNVAMPTLAEGFAASIQAVQWTVIAFVLAITTLIVSVGGLADIVGRKRLLLVGIGVFTTAAAACALAPTLGWLIACRFLQGLGAAVMMALSVALIADLTGKANAGRAMGLLGSMSAVGTALGPALGGLLLAWCGWPAIFLLSVPLGLGGFTLVWRFLPVDPEGSSRRLRDFDTLGSVLLAITLAGYALAMTRRPGGFGYGNVALLGLAMIGLWLFLRVQTRSPAPLLRMELLRDRALRSSLAMSGLVAAVMMSTLVIGPFYLAGSLHLTPGTIGAALSIGPVVAALVANPAGRLVDRIGSPMTTVLGLTGAVGGSLALALLTPAAGVIGYVGPVALMTGGYSLFQTANNTAVMRGAAKAQRGLVAGLLNLSRNLGLVTGTSFLGAVFTFAVREEGARTAAAVAFATNVTFGVATILLIAALALGLRGVRAARGMVLAGAA